MVEVRCSETCKSQQHNILTPSSPMKNLSEKLDMTPTLRSFYSYNGNLSALFGFTGKQRPQYEISLKTQASLKETNNNSPPSGSIQAPNGKGQENSSKINKPQASSKNNHENLPSGDVTLAFSKETCEKSPAADGKCCVGTRNEQTSNDEFPLKRQNIMEEKEEKSELKSIRLTLVDCSVTCVPVYNGQIHADQRSLRSLENVTSFVHFTAKDSNKTFGQQANNYHGVQRLVGDVHPEDSILSTSAIKLNGKYGLQKSTYRGVTRHKWTGKFEAHLWDGSCSTEGRTRKGKQVYLGGYETAEEAARAHDLTVLKYWGPSASAKLNFHISNYEKELEEMESMSREELVTFLRRQSLSFTRGTSIYRGVTSRNREGHWQARIKVASSKKDIYLGTFSSEEEAAKAYDIAAIHLKGINALTNFDVSNYLQGDLKELECFPKPKRVRRIGKFSSLNSDSEIDPCSDENIPQSDSPLDEIVRRKISALLPDHPTAVMPRLRDEHILL